MSGGRFAGIIALSVTAGCVTTQSPVLKTAPVSSGSAYLAGIFRKPSSFIRFGFGIRNIGTGQEVVMAFEEDDVSMIELTPGMYRVRYWETWGVTHEVLTREEFPTDGSVGRPFEIKAGEVVVLGKVAANEVKEFLKSTFTIVARPIRGEDAIASVRAAYPVFTNAPIHCLMCQ
jgi:hypothetical protein